MARFMIRRIAIAHASSTIMEGFQSWDGTIAYKTVSMGRDHRPTCRYAKSHFWAYACACSSSSHRHNQSVCFTSMIIHDWITMWRPPSRLKSMGVTGARSCVWRDVSNVLPHTSLLKMTARSYAGYIETYQSHLRPIRTLPPIVVCLLGKVRAQWYHIQTWYVNSVYR